MSNDTPLLSISQLVTARYSEGLLKSESEKGPLFQRFVNQTMKKGFNGYSEGLFNPNMKGAR